MKFEYLDQPLKVEDDGIHCLTFGLPFSPMAGKGEQLSILTSVNVTDTNSRAKERGM